MLIIDKSTATLVFRAVTTAEDFSVRLVPRSTATGPSSTPGTVLDQVVDVMTGAEVTTVADYTVDLPLNSFYPDLVVAATNNAPGVVTFDGSGTATFVAPGTEDLTITVSALGAKRLTFDVTQVGGQVFNQFVDFTAGSLAKSTRDALLALLTGLTAPIFDGVGGASTPLANIFNADGTRNTSGWWGSIDLTAIPQDSNPNGVLITPQDMIFANHYGAYTSYFQDNAGNSYTREILASQNIAGTDILVATLTAPLPSAITPMKILPANLASYLPELVNFSSYYPAVFTNQDKKLLVRVLENIRDGSFGFMGASPDAALSGWYYPVRGGDSGSPACLLINGALSLLNCWLSTGGGPFCGNYIPQINAILSTNGSPYSVSTTDLSAFSTF
jgi:hypothetical protein